MADRFEQLSQAFFQFGGANNNNNINNSGKKPSRFPLAAGRDSIGYNEDSALSSGVFNFGGIRFDPAAQSAGNNGLK